MMPESQPQYVYQVKGFGIVDLHYENDQIDDPRIDYALLYQAIRDAVVMVPRDLLYWMEMNDDRIQKYLREEAWGLPVLNRLLMKELNHMKGALKRWKGDWDLHHRIIWSAKRPSSLVLLPPHLPAYTSEPEVTDDLQLIDYCDELLDRPYMVLDDLVVNSGKAWGRLRESLSRKYKYKGGVEALPTLSWQLLVSHSTPLDKALGSQLRKAWRPVLSAPIIVFALWTNCFIDDAFGCLRPMKYGWVGGAL